MGEMPSNFSWVIPNKLAGSGFPFVSESIQFYLENGIKAIINLSGKPSEAARGYQNHIIEYDFPVPDFGVPQVDQVKEIWGVVDKHLSDGDAVVVHCIAGCGRTGTILASLLVHLGLEKNIQAAISQTRKVRPCSIETEEQVNFLLNNF